MAWVVRSARSWRSATRGRTSRRNTASCGSSTARRRCSARVCSSRRPTSARTSRRSTTTPNGKAVSGATTLGDLDVYTRSTIYSLQVRRGRLGRSARRQLLRGYPGDLRPAERPHPGQQRQPVGRAGPGRQRRRRLQGLQSALDRDADPGERSRADGHPGAVRLGVLRAADRSRCVRVRQPRTHDAAQPRRDGAQLRRLAAGLAARQPALHRRARRLRGQGPLQPDACLAGRAVRQVRAQSRARDLDQCGLRDQVRGHRARRPREDLHSRGTARRDDHGSGPARRAGRVQPPGLHRRRHDQRRLGWLAERPASRRRRGRHCVDRHRQRPESTRRSPRSATTSRRTMCRITRCSRISRHRTPGSTTARTPGSDAARAPPRRGFVRRSTRGLVRGDGGA